MTRYVLSLGAGVNSTALLHLLVDEHMPLDEVVFADTGAEKPETYAYIETWIKPFLAEHHIPYARVTATKGRGAERTEKSLIERCLRNKTIPSRTYRWCTRDFKIVPIYRHLGIPRKDTKHPPSETWVVYMGIGYDEPNRIKESPEPWVKNTWPLWERRITREGCEAIIASKGWPSPGKSGCFLCPFSSIASWRWIYETHPELWAKAKEIERNGGKYPNFFLHEGTLEDLEKRFRSERAQTKLDTYAEEECQGYCMT